MGWHTIIVVFLSRRKKMSCEVTYGQAKSYFRINSLSLNFHGIDKTPTDKIVVGQATPTKYL